MFETITFWCQVVSGCIILLIGAVWAWNLFKGKLPTTTPSSVISTGNKVAAYVDEATAWTALQTASILFKRHGDISSATAIADLSAKVLLWDEATEGK